MTLETLLNIHGRLDWRDQQPKLQAKGLSFDSRTVDQAYVYVAIRGQTSDGHDYLGDVIGKGAAAVVVEDLSKVPDSFRGAVVQVLDSRLSLQTLSQRFYQSPGDRLLGIAVTGTNGKTSTSYILEYLLTQQQSLCGVIGTIDHHIGEQHWRTGLTTPDPITLQRRLQDFVDAGGESFVIEASSHALAQNRINQGFDVVLFSNLSRDHLDYHKTMDEYFLAKAKLFQSAMLKEGQDCMAVVNGDDEFGQKLIPLIEGRRVYKFGRARINDLCFALVDSRVDGTDINLTIGGEHNFLIRSPLIGEHNAYNLVGSLAVLYGMGFDVKRAAHDIESFAGIPGRMQKITSTNGVFGFVDYAHTPDALEKAMVSLKTLLPQGGRLITVFGCGGDRDKGKRPLMGRIAQQVSDWVIVTSDNPRTEDPAAIIKDICGGFVSGASAQSMPVVERREAMSQAYQLARPGDVILVAGKGHEDYQIIGTQRHDFSDYEVLKSLIHSQ